MINLRFMLTTQHVYERRIQFFGEKKRSGGGERRDDRKDTRSDPINLYKFNTDMNQCLLIIFFSNFSLFVHYLAMGKIQYIL